jgi:hypothetical protein
LETLTVTVMYFWTPSVDRCAERWVEVLKDHSSATLTELTFARSLTSFGVDLSRFSRLATLTLTHGVFSETVIKDVAEMVVAGRCPSSLTMIDMTGVLIQDFSPLDKLLEKPGPRPVRLEIENWPVTIGGSSRRTLPALTLDLRYNDSYGYSYNRSLPTIPPLLSRAYYTSVAAEGRFTFEGRPGEPLMDESLLDLIVQQGIKFPDFVPLVRIPFSLLTWVPRLVRPGRSLNLEINKIKSRNEVTSSELDAKLIEALGSALSLTAGDVKVTFFGYADELFGPLLKPIFSAGSFDLLHFSSLELKISSKMSLEWSRQSGSLTVYGMPAEVGGDLGSSLMESSADIRNIEITTSVGVSPDRDLLHAMLAATESVSLSVSSDVDPVSVFSTWAGMIRAGAVRRWRTASVDGAYSVRLGDNQVSIHGYCKLPPLGDFVSMLCSVFGVDTISITSFMLREHNAQEDPGLSSNLQGLGKALCAATSATVHLASKDQDEGKNFPYLIDRLVEPLVADGAGTLLGKSEVSLSVHQPSWGKRVFFDWRNNGDSRSLGLQNPSAAFLSKASKTLHDLSLSSFKLRCDPSLFDLSRSSLPAVLLAVTEEIDVNGFEVYSVVSAWDKLIKSGIVPILKDIKLAGGDAVLEAGGGKASIRTWQNANTEIIPALVTILQTDFKVVSIEVIADSVPDPSKLAEALAEASDIAVILRRSSSSPAQALSALVRPFLSDGDACFLVKHRLSMKVGDARFTWEGGDNPSSLDVKGLPVGDLGLALGMVKKSTASLSSLEVHLDSTKDLKKVADSLSELLLHPKRVGLYCPDLDVRAQLVSWIGMLRTRALPVWEKLEVRGNVDLRLVDSSARVKVTNDGLSSLADLVSTLCNDCGVTDLHLEVRTAARSSVHLTRLAGLLPRLPLSSLTVSGEHKEWVINVAHPGPGSLRHLAIEGGLPSKLWYTKLATLLGPNESLVSVEFPRDTARELVVDPANFRLLKGSTLSGRNKRNRSKLASLLSALPVTTEDIPSALGLAIRRVQVNLKQEVKQEVEEEDDENEEAQMDVEEVAANEDSFEDDE